MHNTYCLRDHGIVQVGEKKPTTIPSNHPVTLPRLRLNPVPQRHTSASPKPPPEAVRAAGNEIALHVLVQLQFAAASLPSTRRQGQLYKQRAQKRGQHSSLCPGSPRAGHPGHCCAGLRYNGTGSGTGSVPGDHCTLPAPGQPQPRARSIAPGFCSGTAPMPQGEQRASAGEGLCRCGTAAAPVPAGRAPSSCPGTSPGSHPLQLRRQRRRQRGTQGGSGGPGSPQHHRSPAACGHPARVPCREGPQSSQPQRGSTAAPPPQQDPRNPALRRAAPSRPVAGDAAPSRCRKALAVPPAAAAAMLPAAMRGAVTCHSRRRVPRRGGDASPCSSSGSAAVRRL